MQAIDNTNLLNMCRDCGADGFIPEAQYSYNSGTDELTITNSSTIPSGDALKLIKIKVHDFFGNTAFGAIMTQSGGFGYQSVPTVTITGDGTGATAHAVLTNGRVTSIVVDTGGSGYTTATVTITGGNGFGAKATATLNTGAVASIAVSAAPATSVISLASLDKSKPLAVSVFIETTGGIVADGGAYGLLNAGDIGHWDVQKNASVS